MGTCILIFVRYQKEIYRSGKVTGAVRILKGQEILPDDNSVAQYNISDGDTLNIIIEPVKEITITIKPGNSALSDVSNYKYVVKNSISAQEVKKSLATEKDMVIPENEFDLVHDGDEQLVPLDDSILPLHFYGLKDGSEILIEKHIISRFIENQKGAVVHMKLSVNATVADLRKRLMKQISRHVDNITLFTYLEETDSFKTLTNDDETLGSNEIFYVVENAYTKMLNNIFFSNSEDVLMLGDIHNPRTIVGTEIDDTVLSVKLRGQEQLNVPVNRIEVNLLDDTFSVCGDNDVIKETAMYSVEVVRKSNES